MNDITVLGLRHVGYVIPAEFFAPLVNLSCGGCASLTADETAEDAFR